MFLTVGGLIALAAAGAAAGAFLASWRGAAWTALGASIAAATMLMAGFFWDHLRERDGSDGGSGGFKRARGIRVRQRIGFLGKGGRAVAVRSRGTADGIEVRQRIDTAGEEATIVGYDVGPTELS